MQFADIDNKQEDFVSAIESKSPSCTAARRAGVKIAVELQDVFEKARLEKHASRAT
jgi:hypothetical protein